MTAQTKSKNKKQTLAVYPGAFDPITNGHLSLVERAASIFDRVIVAVAENESKNTLFSFEERLALAKKVFGRRKGIEIDSIDGLTAVYAKKHSATAIIRGIRAVSDFEYEFQMALMNRKLARSVETVFLMPALSWVYLSSTLLKDVAKNGGDISTLAPAPVVAALKKKFAKK
jgi:pantetheine-phosphate adenylyltransferase